MAGFKMGTLDHMHLLVPDRFAAARWYHDQLGFEIIDQYRVWAEVPAGPLHISADGGQSALALFERGKHPDFRVEKWVAFRVTAEQFVAFADGLAQSDIRDAKGNQLTRASVVDHDLCFAYYFQDPWGNPFELDCYEYEAVKRDLLDRHGIAPIRFF
jgi:catechol-2,3-dioxygenase